MERLMYFAQDLNKWAPIPLRFSESKLINISDKKKNYRICKNQIEKKES
jgi:hypothetical protein